MTTIISTGLRSALLATTVFCATAFAAHASTMNLIVNGDFEAGNTGFTTDLVLGSGANTFLIADNPRDKNGAFASFGDNTTGFGNMMIVNGSTISTTVAWSQTVAVNADTSYAFGGFLANAFPAAPASFDVRVNGVSVGSVTDTIETGIWDEFSFDWFSGSETTAILELIETSTGFGGNDYALDDLSFTATGVADPGPAPIPLPAGALLMGTALAGFGFMRRKPS